jgi:putative FmdB family regulatory protein
VPTYEYECDRCHRVYEVQQRISAPPLTECQYCKGPIRRLLAAAPFILKGGGWYVTDYPSESRKKAMDAEKKKTSDAPAASGKPADAKSSDAKSSDPKSSDAKSSDPKSSDGASAPTKSDSSASSSTSGTGGSSTTA